MTALDVVKMEAPSISSLNKGTGSTNNGIGVFFLVILDLLEYFGVEWSENTPENLANLLFSEYHFLSMAELKHFAAKVKLGDYGKIYGKFSPNDLTIYLGEYVDEALKARAGYQQNKQEPELELQPGDIGPERAKELLQEMVEGWANNIYEQHPQVARTDTYQDKLKAWMITHGIDPQKFLDQDPDTVAKYETLIANLKAA